MSRPCGPWPCPGREVRHERSRPWPTAWRSTWRTGGPWAIRLRIEGQLLRSFARYADESGHRGPLTTELALRWARLPEQATRLYQARRLEMVRTLAEYLAPREPGTEVPPARLARPGPLLQDGLHLLRGRHRRADRGGPVARPGRRPAPPDVRDPDRADGLHRAAHRRGPHPGGRRRRPGGRRPDGPPDQVPQVPAGPPAPQRHRAASRLCRGPRPPPAGAARRDLLRVGCRPAAALRDRAAHVPPPAAAGDAGGGPDRPRTAAPPRPAAHVRLPPPAGLVSRRDRHRPGHRPALGLPRPRQGHRHLLVPDRHPGAAGPGRPALRAVRRPRPGEAPHDPSLRHPGPGLLLPPADRAAGRQPAHGRGLSRHLPAVAGLPPATPR